MKKRVLITGCTGQDGSYLADILLDQGWEVHGLYRRSSTGNFANIQHLLGKITLHQGDMTDYGSLERAVTKSDPLWVFNMADQDNIDWSFSMSRYSVDVTAGGVSNLLEILKGRKVRFFQPLSITMFVPGKCDENSRLAPESPYACAKCFTPRTKVLTETGWKRIASIRVGDMVWTHKGRLRRVTQVYEREYGDPLVVINAGSGRGTSLYNFQVSTTPEHPILTEKGWVKAGKITLDDKVMVLASSCKNCGEKIPAYNTFCGRSCKAVYRWNNDPEFREQTTERARAYTNEHKQFSTPAALKNMRKGVARNLKRRGPNYMEVYLDALFQVCCPGFFKFVGDGKVEIGGCYPDWINEKEKAIIEFLGYGDWKKERVEGLERKVKIFEEAGYRVLTLKNFNDVETIKRQVAEFVSSLGSLDFIPVKVRRVTAYETTTDKRVFNLEVEEDETYIAQGIVVHNCHAWHLCKMYRSLFGMDVCCGIFANHDSPRRHGDYLLHRICKEALRPTGSINVPPLTFSVDIGYAKDYMRDTIAIMGLDNPNDFVIGGTVTTGKEIALIALEALGRDEPYRIVEKPYDRPGVQRTWRTDSFKLTTFINRWPTLSLRDLVRLILDKYRGAVCSS